MIIRDQKKRKKLLCALLAGAVIVCEAGGAVCVSASGTEGQKQRGAVEASVDGVADMAPESGREAAPQQNPGEELKVKEDMGTEPGAGDETKYLGVENPGEAYGTGTAPDPAGEGRQGVTPGDKASGKLFEENREQDPDRESVLRGSAAVAQPGKTYADALELKPDTVFTAVTGTARERTHWYKFTLSKPGMVSVTFDHVRITGQVNTGQLNAKAWEIVFCADASGNGMYTKTSGVNDTSVRTTPAGLAAGTYYIKVEGDLIVPEKTPYSIRINYEEAVCETEPNNSLAAACRLPFHTVVSGSLMGLLTNPADYYDYYRVTMEKPGALQVEFAHDVIAGSETTAVYQISVLDKNGNELMSRTSRGGENVVKTPQIGLAAGNYFIEVKAAMGNAAAGIGGNVAAAYENAYRIRADYTPGNWEQESNDSFSTANPIRSGREYTGSIHKSAGNVIPGISGGGDKDYYRIELAKAGYLQVKLTHEDTGTGEEILKVRVYNAGYKEVDTFLSRGMETAIKTPKIGLPKGSYYIVVEDNARGYLGNYGLTVTAKEASGWETEPNGSSSSADQIRVGKEVTGVSRSISDNDWFRFTLDKASYINFSITHAKADSVDMAWYVTLLDENGRRVSYKSNGYIYAYAKDHYAESASATLGKGTYYIKVQPADSVGVGMEYRLSVNRVKAVQPQITSVTSKAYNKLKVSWKAVPGAEQYILYRSTSKKGTYEKVRTIGNIATTSWTDTKVSTGKTYYYKMKATVKTGSGSKTGKASAAVSGRAVPAAVSLKITTPSAGQIKLSWNKAAGADGYEIYRSTSGNGKYKKVKVISKGNVKTYTQKELTSGKTYYYKVRAFCRVNGKKVYGSESKVVSKKVK